MSKLESYYGKETRIFVTSYFVGDGSLEISELQTPLRVSIKEYLFDCGSGYKPIHVFLNPNEGLIFISALSEIMRRSFKSNKKAFRKTYLNILEEQNIDVKDELLTASNELSDDDARDYLRKLNLELRQHLENYSINYNNPVRLSGQKGALRKPKNIDPVRVSWPNG